MTTPPNADMTKYCRYHRNHGHTTDDCKALQDKIEELVCASHFRRFIHRDDHPSRARHPPPSDHRRHPHDSRHDRRPTQPTNQDPQPTRIDVTLVDPPLRGTIKPSLVVSLVENPSLVPERNTSAISNPSTILPIPITYAACLPSPLRTTTSTA